MRTCGSSRWQACNEPRWQCVWHVVYDSQHVEALSVVGGAGGGCTDAVLWVEGDVKETLGGLSSLTQLRELSLSALHGGGVAQRGGSGVDIVSGTCACVAGGRWHHHIW